MLAEDAWQGHDALRRTGRHDGIMAERRMNIGVTGRLPGKGVGLSDRDLCRLSTGTAAQQGSNVPAQPRAPVMIDRSALLRARRIGAGG